MRKVLYFFGKFTDQDLDWFIGAGKKEEVEKGHVLIQEGNCTEWFYITLSGSFEVAKKGTPVASIGAGEVLGELTFLDSRPPAASVIAAGDAVVLSISISRLRTKLRVDTGFASRFYLALGVLLADRLRETTSHLALGSIRHLDEAVEEFNEIPSDLLDNTALAAARFDKLCQIVLS